MIEKLQKAWKELTLISAWITTVASPFVLPLPSWSNSTVVSTSYLKFIIFFATIIAGFLVLHTYKNRSIKSWYRYSISFFILLTICFISYSYTRESKTLPYEGIDVIIGNERIENDPLTKLENSNKFNLNDEEILKHVQGQSDKIWTKKSINTNKNLLIVLLVLIYTLTASLIISFCNLLILHKDKQQKENKKS
ncbi:hypothetical protein [Winogradskyella sp.]|uniref:hypothetical protein n=1 Tax=Winogradskyella sp. TaxID=1883156 RepID=UPI00263A3D41|nr:hypothetical protein [Winogradskyella sp.]